MKRFLSILIFLLCLNINSQAPQGFNYQATVRNSSGDLILNQNVYFKFNIMQGSPTSLPVYTEIHYVPTDDLGQVNLIIGQGTPTAGFFSDVNWSLGNYHFGIELNTGSGYIAMGTTQMLSVPYALYAENAGNSQPTTPTLEDVLAAGNSANFKQIKKIVNGTEIGDAVNKFYVDSLTANNKIMKFESAYSSQILTDNTTFQLEKNTFVFIAATNTTLILPNSPSKQGDLVYIFYMPPQIGVYDTTLQVSNLAIRFYQNSDNNSTDLFSGTVTGYFERGLNTLVNIGDYWMCGGFLSQN